MIVKHWEDRGFVCFINHNDTFDTFNGYIAVPKSHPWHGKLYEDIDVVVHGGLTFSENLGGHWVLGFDTNHSGDAYGPNAAINVLLNSQAGYLNDGIHKGLGYVEGELSNLVDQALELGPGFDMSESARCLLGVKSLI